MKIKALCLDEMTVYQYPEGITSLDAFMQFVNATRGRFIPLYRFDTKNCVSPYYIEEDKTCIYVNFSAISTVEEEEIHVLSKAEYDIRLNELIESKCTYCVHNNEDMKETDLKSYRNNLCLDGNCFLFEEI